MIAHRRILVALSLIGLATAGGIACRQDEPAGDPKTPANSPLPRIDRRDDDPKAAPTPKLPLFGGDAG